MKIRVLTSNLQEKLSFLNHAVSTKSQLPILLNILLETTDKGIRLTSTDLEIGIEIHIPATIEVPGEVVIPAKLFSELVASLTEETIELQTKENILEVLTKKTKSIFQTVNKDEFPKLYEEKGEKIASLDSRRIAEDVSSVVFAASQDISRPALSGVLIRKEQGGFLLVATDGYRLSLRHYKTTEDDNKAETTFIVPARVLRELLAIKEKEEEIAMYVLQASNQVIFEQGSTTLVGRLIEATYPPFEKIIPSDFSASVLFDKEELQKAVKICSIFARDSANIIKLSFKKDHILVSSQTPSLGENTVTVESVLKGEENDIAFNARYLQDLLSNIDEKELLFEMTGPLNPGVFKVKEDTSYLHLIMPIRTQQ
jgi:DNA polymerase III subunit beta